VGSPTAPNASVRRSRAAHRTTRLGRVGSALPLLFLEGEAPSIRHQGLRSSEACAVRWAVASRRTLASEAIVRPSGPRPLFDGRDLATCSSLENGHLRYLRDLRAPCVDEWRSDAFVSLCLRVCDVRGSVCLLCASVSLWFNPGEWVGGIPNS
jgi:hypothetical protein